ncbi:MAG: hypothetical protein JXR03_19125 [Cyclobacteriaceae bacterium]
MRLRKYVLCISIFCSSVAYAQDPLIKEEILNYRDTSVLLIKNSRGLIINSVKTWNIEKAAEVYQYLNDHVDENLPKPFYPQEDLITNIVIRKYKQALEQILEQSNSGSQYANGGAYMFVNDYYYYQLVRLVESYQSKIESDIDHYMDSSIEDKDFIKLYLNVLLIRNRNFINTQEALNLIGNQYLTTHKNSVYESYIRGNVIFETVSQQSAFDFYMGSGYLNITGNTANYIKAKVPAIIGFDFIYKRWILGFKIIGGGGDIKDDLNVKGQDFQRGEVALNPLFFDFYGGFHLISNNRLRLYPTVSIGGFSVSPVENDARGNKKFDLSSFVFGVGGGLDVKIFEWESSGYYGEIENELGIKFIYQSSKFNFDKVTPDLSGRHSIYGASLYWEFRNSKRRN